MLRVARRLGSSFPVTVRTTLLAAHAVPPEFAARADAYIGAVAEEWLPQLAAEGLVDAVDIFCESVAFDTSQAERLFQAATKLRLPVKMHAEQLSRIGGSQLAARYGALSCDHLEWSTPEDARALARAGTVAVLLPVAFYGLGLKRPPPVAAFRAAGTRMAVATDCNPGSAPGASLLLALSMATRLFGLTPEEALGAATVNAAQAIGCAGTVGTLGVGSRADFAVWNIRDLEEIGYWTGYNPCRAVIRAGRLVRGQLSVGEIAAS
jgi:imidazolonepropionase